MSAQLFIDEKVIRPSHLKAQFGICHKTLYNWIHTGVLPKPRKIGPQMVGWFLSDLEGFYAKMSSE